MCAVSDSCDLGVDTEQIREPYLDIVERFFALPEKVAFYRAESDERAPLFFKYWTLKEAYTKARGCGLSIALDSFAIAISDKGIRLEVAEHLDPRAQDWTFWSAHPTKTHVAAICADGGAGEVRVQEAWVPSGREFT
jgi:4'-phosphopantetheinyl transferase